MTENNKPESQSYDHKAAESKWQEYWEKNEIYKWDEQSTREETYSIDTPPPTVSGLLHMGHIFSYTQADFIARYQRMKGKSVFYPMGFDDNGLPTERLVEKVKKIRATEMPREDFIKVCMDVVKDAEEEFRSLFRSTALSVDWTQEYQTISEHTRKISQMSFIDMFKKNNVYRTLQPTLWDPVDRTALSQADIEDKEMPSSMKELTFFIDELKRPNGMREEVLIATTRPELLAACVAVFYHPEDKRYEKLKGKTAITPIFGVKVPFLADEKVDPEKGTGLVMCCTFGDQTDVDWWKKHKLPTRVILDKAGRIANLQPLGESPEWHSINAPVRLQAIKDRLTGLKIKEAREIMLEALKYYGCLAKQTDITHSVKFAERSGAPLEILVTPQWFVKVLDKKQELLEKINQCEWRPDFMKLRAEQWVNGLSWDWCISRQRFFGVPFPVWYVKDASKKDLDAKTIVASPEQLPVNPLSDLPLGYKLKKKMEDGSFLATCVDDGKDYIVTPDFDVMDTWATSSVSPQINSHAINAEFKVSDISRHEKLFPFDLRPQAHEIIRTWAFYTIVKAHLHEEQIPWQNLMISGWCLASDKTKMSKSKGNVVTPVELIVDKGADAVRYWASTSRLGTDTAFSEDLLKIGKKLVNKLWNASIFSSQHFGKLRENPTTAASDISSGKIAEPLDRWIISRLNKTIAKATQKFDEYEYADARSAIEDFFWNDLCDNYLELVKVRSYGELCDEKKRDSAIYTLYHVLEAVLRLFAPFVPHITEELYSKIYQEKFKDIKSIHSRGNWPDANSYPADVKSEKLGIATVSILNAVRKLKSEQKVSIKHPINNLLIMPSKAGSEDIKTTELESVFFDLAKTTSSEKVELSESISSGIKSEDGMFVVEAILADKAA